MDRFVAILSLSLVFSFNAQAAEKGLTDIFFRVVPEAEAHSSQGSATSREFKRDSVKALIWNVKKSLLFNWKKEFVTYAKNQDLILIQEAYQTELFRKTTSEFFGYRWDMGISFLYRRYNNQATGTMIGSVVEPTFVLVKHSPDLEPLVKTPKAMTMAKYPIEGKHEELLVISIHGINLTGFSTFKRHIQQAEKEIMNHEGPILFAGDFNTRTAARTDYLLKLSKKYNLRPVVFKNGHHRMRWKLTANYLDHSFVRGLTVKAAEVKPDSSGSDHKPMLVEFSVD